MGLFDTPMLTDATAIQQPIFGANTNVPTTNPTMPSLLPSTPAVPAANGMPGNNSLASLFGMIAGAIGGPNSVAGRVGTGVQQVANGGMMAQAMLEREKGQRDFLSKLLTEHGKSKLATDSILGLTPSETGGISSSMTGG